MRTFSWDRHPNLTINYDPSLVLPPDEASMALAWSVVRALRQIRETQGNPDLPLRLLDIGTGCGVIAAAAACMDNLEVVGFDKDPFAVELARKNIQQAIQTRNVQGTTVQTFIGD